MGALLSELDCVRSNWIVLSFLQLPGVHNLRVGRLGSYLERAIKELWPQHNHISYDKHCQCDAMSVLLVVWHLHHTHGSDAGIATATALGIATDIFADARRRNLVHCWSGWPAPYCRSSFVPGALAVTCSMQSKSCGFHVYIFYHELGSFDAALWR